MGEEIVCESAACIVYLFLLIEPKLKIRILHLGFKVKQAQKFLYVHQMPFRDESFSCIFPYRCRERVGVSLGGAIYIIGGETRDAEKRIHARCNAAR
jgi:hypothetical protein